MPASCRRHLERQGSSLFHVLSAREQEMLQMLSDGLSIKQIAVRLAGSVKRVGTHLKQIIDKFDIHSIAELAKYVIRKRIMILKKRGQGPASILEIRI